MNIRIHTFADPLGGEAVWAVALREGDLVTDGALASGSDDRSASNAALAAFWKREDSRAQAAASTSILSENIFASPASGFNAIRTMIEAAIAADPRERDTLRIGYNDARGEFTSRLIVPSQISGGSVFAYDVSRDDARSFRLDRIASAEVVR